MTTADGMIVGAVCVRSAYLPWSGPFLACYGTSLGISLMADPTEKPVFPAPLPAKPRELFIRGLTSAGRTFRPSDWAERLCGVMSPYRPEGTMASHAHLGYSPYVRPCNIDGVKCVIVDERLREIEPMAWDFVVAFARDNDLQTFEACELPEPPSSSTVA